jgi:hypothetical protein
MSVEDAEFPEAQRDARLGPESLGPVNRTNRRLYLAVIVILGVVLLVGVIGWLTLAANDKSMPEGLGVILGAVSGGLVSLVSDKERA